MTKKILITGMTGFIGSRFADYILDNTDWEIISLERVVMRHQRMVRSLDDRITRYYIDDLSKPLSTFITSGLERMGVDFIVHCAAEVGRAGVESESAVMNNIGSDYQVLELARMLKPEKFLYVSSTAVLGATPDVRPWDSLVGCPADERSPLKPLTLYAASKAAGELLVSTYRSRFHVPTVIIRPCNIFGERQDFQKFIPIVTRKVLNGEKVICHVDEQGDSVSKQWLHVGVLADRLYRTLTEGAVGEVYHAVGPRISNHRIVHLIANILNRPVERVDELAPSGQQLLVVLDSKSADAYADDTDLRICETAKWYEQNRDWL